MKNVQRKIRRVSLSAMGNNVQQKWANGMESIFKRLSIKAQKWLFLLAFVGASVYCFSLLLGNGSGGLPDIGKIKNLRPPDMRTIDIDSSTPETKINKLKQYLDTLPAVQRDSLLSHYPGIVDSIQRWEQQLRALKK